MFHSLLEIRSLAAALHPPARPRIAQRGVHAALKDQIASNTFCKGFPEDLEIRAWWTEALLLKGRAVHWSGGTTRGELKAPTG